MITKQNLQICLNKWILPMSDVSLPTFETPTDFLLLRNLNSDRSKPIDPEARLLASIQCEAFFNGKLSVLSGCWEENGGTWKNNEAKLVQVRVNSVRSRLPLKDSTTFLRCEKRKRFLPVGLILVQCLRSPPWRMGRSEEGT